MDLLISDPALGLTESQCLVLAKNHTLAVSNVNGTAPANVWNFCATGVCKYTFANGTTGVFVSPYAGSHTASVCQLGYSSAVDNNDYLEAAVIQAPGQGNAGKGGGGASVMLPYCLCFCLSYWLLVFAFCVVFAFAFLYCLLAFAFNIVLAFAFHIAFAFHVAFAFHTAFVVFVCALAPCWPSSACIADAGTAGSCAVACCAVVPSSALLINTTLPWTLFLCAILCPSHYATFHTFCKALTAGPSAQLLFATNCPADCLD